MTLASTRKRLIGEKAALRKKISEEVSALDMDFRKKADALITEKLEDHSKLKSAVNLMLYIALKDEVQTITLINSFIEQKKIYVPVIEDNKLKACLLRDLRFLVKGKYGVLEPEPSGREYVQPDQLDLILVPGQGFSPEGKRLGRGGGYYDGFLAAVPLSTYKLGVCYSVQLREFIPTAAYDIGVDEVITEKDKGE